MAGLKICIITILLTVIYLAGSVFLSNVLFYNKANGSIIKYENKPIGSRLIGQQFQKSIYFHGRPSASNYKNDISGSSNFSYYSNDLKQSTLNNNTKFLLLNKTTKPDLNLITESASGLDPHITYEGALRQADRVSTETRINKKDIIDFINKFSRPRILGLFGQKITNVLELNLKLNKELHAKAVRSR